MTTENIIATLKQGVPVTARLVREIIGKFERLDWAERSLKAALEKYGNDAGAVKLSAEETSFSVHRTAIEPQAGTKSNHGSNHKKSPAISDGADPISSCSF